MLSVGVQKPHERSSISLERIYPYESLSQRALRIKNLITLWFISDLQYAGDVGFAGALMDIISTMVDICILTYRS